METGLTNIQNEFEIDSNKKYGLTKVQQKESMAFLGSDLRQMYIAKSFLDRMRKGVSICPKE